MYKEIRSDGGHLAGVQNTSSNNKREFADNLSAFYGLDCRRGAYPHSGLEAQKRLPGDSWIQILLLGSKLTLSSRARVKKHTSKGARRRKRGDFYRY